MRSKFVGRFTYYTKLNLFHPVFFRADYHQTAHRIRILGRTTRLSWIWVLIIYAMALPVCALTNTEVAKLVASDAVPAAEFGDSLSMDGDRAVIGAPNSHNLIDRPGSVYVFERNRNGRWIEVSKVLSPEATAGDFFGRSVSVTGDRMVVGAVDTVNGVSSGVAYILERDNSGAWVDVAKLVAAGEPENNSIGSVAMDGSTVVVAARINGRGAALVYERDVLGTWNQVAQLQAGDVTAGDNLGGPVSIDGDRIAAIGSTIDEFNSASRAVYVFERDSVGVWNQAAKLVAAGLEAGQKFGFSVTIDRNRVLVGAPSREVPGFSVIKGAAFIFERDNSGTWSQVAKLRATNGVPSSVDLFDFGDSVAMDGDRAVIGGVFDEGFDRGNGAAYVFDRDFAGDWKQNTTLLASDGEALDFLGNSVSVDGDQILVGAVFDSDPVTGGTGSVYVFDLRERQSIRIWDQTTVPKNPAVEDHSAVKLGVKFTTEVDGKISGILFYKGLGNEGFHFGQLWTASGDLLATTLFTGETVSGWQQSLFRRPVPVSAGENYVASYSAPFGRYAADHYFFSDSGSVNGPIRLLQDGVSGGNGVFVYGNSLFDFPQASYHGSNYWVDVLFTPDNVPVTGSPGTCPCSLWDHTSIPDRLTDHDADAVELGVKFSSDVAGYISAIRFYKSEQNTGSHVGRLWSGDGQLLAEATFVDETGSGWQQVDFASPVAISANTQYVASYHTDTGHYSVDTDYFSAAARRNGPLKAPSGEESGGNGVYLYGAGGFPSETWFDSNYWVDVVFVTDLDP